MAECFTSFNDALFICSAGNGAHNTDINPQYPACLAQENILTVAASDMNDNLASFSNWGAKSVDVAAPGLGVYSTLRGSYASMSGTSMAGPHVAGIAALIKAVAPSFTAAQIKSVIINGVDKKESFNGKMVSGGRVNAKKSLELAYPAPTITHFTPSTGLNSGPVPISNLSGTYFLNGVKVTLTKSGYANITARNVTVISPSRITCILPITGAAGGLWDAVVMNPDGKTGIRAGAFTIIPVSLSPTIMKISPDSGYNTGNVTITITGKNYKPKATVKLTKGNSTKTAAVRKITSTQIICILPISRVTAGTYSLTVRNTDGKSITKKNAFTVLNPGKKPAITLITPNIGSTQMNMTVAITGTNFRVRAVVQMVKGSTIKKATIRSITTKKIICTFPTKGAATGKWNVKMTNTDGTTVTKTNGFTIKKRLIL